MRAKKTRLTLTLAFAFILAATTGCRSGKAGRGAPGGDLGPGGITPYDLDTGWEAGDIPMDGMRFESLTRVTDAGAFSPVYFAYDAFNIAATESAKIAYAAEFLKLNPEVVLVVEGHCDERGTHEYNLSLGEYRALAVRDQMIALGIAPARIQTSSFGKERPADHGHNEAAWAKNRRADFSFYRR